MMEKDSIRAIGEVPSESNSNPQTLQTDPFINERSLSAVDLGFAKECLYQGVSHKSLNDHFEGATSTSAINVSDNMKTTTGDLATAFNSAEESLLTFDFTDWLRDQNMMPEGYSDESPRISYDLGLVVPPESTSKSMSSPEIFKNSLDDHSQTPGISKAASSSASFDKLNSGKDKSIGTSLGKSNRKETGGSDLLLIMEVCLSEGKSETLPIYENANPFEVASAFCYRHCLQEDLSEKLAQQIRSEVTMLKSQNVEDADLSENVIAENLSKNGSPTETPETSPKKGFSDPTFTNSPHPNINGSRSTEIVYGDDETRYNALLQRYGSHTHHTAQQAVGKKSDDGRSIHNTKEAYSRRMMQENKILETADAFAPLVYLHAKCTQQTMKHEAVHDRLYALAERKAKWIKREQERKAGKDDDEFVKLTNRQLLSSRSRKLVMHHVPSSNYSHAGERLYQEAHSDLARRERQRCAKKKLLQAELTWSCPKCAHVNQHSDSNCRNTVALISADKLTKKKRANQLIVEAETTRCKFNGTKSSHSTDSGTIAMVAHFCSQPKPTTMFQPTLLASFTKSGKKLQHQSKEELKQSTVDRRKRDKHLMEELYQKTFPFQPKINAVSGELVHQRSERLKRLGINCGRVKSDIYEALYEHAFEKQATQEARELEYVKSIPFKPDIGINHHWVTGDQSKNDLINRLSVSHMKESEQERIKLMEKYSSDRDPETGRPFFSPSTGRSPYISRNEDKLPIGDYLNTFLATRANQQVENSQAVVAELKARSNRPYTLRRSQQILAQKKRKVYHTLFEFLISRQIPQKSVVSVELVKDGEHAEKEKDDGRISRAKNIDYVDLNILDVGNLPADIINTVILLRDSAKESPVSRATFVALLDAVLKKNSSLSYPKLLVALDHVIAYDNNSTNSAEQNRDDLDEMTFHPVIDPHSDYLTNKRGRVQKSRVYETLNQHYEHYEHRKLQARKIAESDFAQQYTFQPKINKNKRPTSAFYQKYTNDIIADGMSDVFHPPLSTSPTAAHPFVRAISLKE
uniref:Uncharacterized protein AlNc14C107G6244 n=1 Tax=Albugo laibachii Nc14 TaxID=890382 RepID=F0WI37_9STRA|nr:conserved hypothetical protein [Albugo laibachii Nc14]|eukprot:CCA20915.1 conserved hypothetical protein [Albugo laibachii Nc14]